MKDTTKRSARYAMGDPRWEMGDQGSEKEDRRGEMRDGRRERTEHKTDDTEEEMRDEVSVIEPWPKSARLLFDFLDDFENHVRCILGPGTAALGRPRDASGGGSGLPGARRAGQRARSSGLQRIGSFYRNATALGRLHRMGAGGAGAGLTEVAEAARQRLQHPAAAAVGSRQCGRSQKLQKSKHKTVRKTHQYQSQRKG